MQNRNGQIIISASDIANFLECPHSTSLALIDLDTPLVRAAPDEQVELIQDKGFAHEAEFLDSLRRLGGKIVELKSSGDLQEKLAATVAAMRDGADVIYQAALSDGTAIGYADFFHKVDTPSGLGAWSYEVSDTKLAHRPKPKFLIQLAYYSELLSVAQGKIPEHMHLVLGDQERTKLSYRVGDYLHYYRGLRQRFDAFLGERPATYPEKCAHCSVCDWRERCARQWENDDHLNGVANISKVQIRRLQENNIHTLANLGRLAVDATIPKMQPATFTRLRAQAALQLKKRETGENQLELLPRNSSKRIGFDRLPAPDPGDLFFDMEGDPLHEGGLEYLFGVYYMDQGKPVFSDFWGHDRQGEKAAFVAFVDFAISHLALNPRAHIYHYANYEVAAMQKLMSLHGTREAEIDQLLREGKFIDLFKVVREAIRVSEPRYSIKNLETFYMEKREGEVTNAGASIVFYEKWRRSGDDDLLRKIRDYNQDDCRSTFLLHQWLLGLSQGKAALDEVIGDALPVEKSEAIKDHEARLAAYETRLLGGLPEDRANWNEDQHLRELVFHLLDFHRRAAKPVWWSLFARRDMSDEELTEDYECIAGLQLQSIAPPTTARGANIATYRYPEQEFKLQVGTDCIRTDETMGLGKIVAIDEDQHLIEIKISGNKEIPENGSISTGGPLNTNAIKEALFRVADSLLAEDNQYAAALDFLRKTPPRIKGHKAGTPIVKAQGESLQQIIDAVAKLDHSVVFIQGPPGAGKTYTGSHLISALIQQGFRVGVSSNSHKAIHNLLHAVEERAKESGEAFSGVYKASAQAKGSEFEGRYIGNAKNNDEVVAALESDDVHLVAGTAWLFSDAAMNQELDYLFVDEAGQVAVANLVAMATSARNIVLLGDQMQLGQPVQGVHPGESGLSSLDFLLGERATIEPDRGIFLATTWRMHPDLCRFISDAVYEGRLHAEAKNANQRLILNDGAHPALRPTGLRFVAAQHDTCSQSSQEEAEIVRELYLSLLELDFVDRNGKLHPMKSENILIVAPYNMQVNLIKRNLPAEARVGTVDKFQGQEAEAVIVSMTTSSGDYLPRYVEFLYSKNRLNVALSRARCLALLVANPKLADISCATVEQMGLVNTLCGAMEYSVSLQ